MKLKTATLLAIIGMCYMFLSRTVGTIVPGLFRNLAVTQVSVVLSLLSGVALVVFFMSFYKFYIREEQGQLYNATVLAVIGSAAMLVLYIKGLFIVFAPLRMQLYGISPMLMEELSKPSFFEAILPWFSAILMLVFYMTFYKESTDPSQFRLQKAASYAVIGAVIGVLLRTLMVVGHIFSSEVLWFTDVTRGVGIILVPVLVISFAAIIYFYLVFYSEQQA